MAGCSTNTSVVRSPPIIDSHVHLAYWPVGDQLIASGVLGVVDLSSPEDRIPSFPHVIFSGPMLTRPGGYPLESWGSDGYGIGCADEACVRSTIDRLSKRGARVCKIAMGPIGLDVALLPAAVAACHAANMKVAVHALTNNAALDAARAGADVLAHTPTERLEDVTVAAWHGRAVISSLAAFGGEPDTVENLRRLRAAGVTVLYGTDLGNERDAGPSQPEIALLRAAGLDDKAIVESMTSVPAKYWGIELGNSYLEVNATDVKSLLAPRAIFLDGKRVR